MENIFDSPRMAEGYAHCRPAVHPRVVELIQDHLRITTPVVRALDIGCGAGLSTAPLLPLARQVIGIEPSQAMVRLGPKVAPQAGFAAGMAETIPIRSGSIDLVTAAGSLNWSDLSQVFPEIRRVLADSGVFVLYDFGQGSESPTAGGLAGWHEEFKHRYPAPPAREIRPEALDTEFDAFRLTAHQPFEIALSLSPGFYLEYAMTETNVAEAIGNGIPEAEIREWCEQTLNGVFQGTSHDVLFAGYVAYFAL